MSSKVIQNKSRRNQDSSQTGPNLVQKIFNTNSAKTSNSSKEGSP